MKPRLMIIGAHPDDAELNAAGLMLRYAANECAIGILCLTDGSAGHQATDRHTLAQRRAEEAARAATMVRAQLEIWDVADGALEASMTNRERLIKAIRLFAPDLLITHRPQDYHPDHRAAAQLVQDACYMVRVPNVVPEVAPLPFDVVVAYMCDFFKRPQPFQADVVLPLDQYFDNACELLACHESQVDEWLPHMAGVAQPEPASHPSGGWLRTFYAQRAGAIAKRYAQGQCQYAEALELSEYGRRIDPQELRALCLLESISV